MAVQYGSNVKSVPPGGVQYSTGTGVTKTNTATTVNTPSTPSTAMDGSDAMHHNSVTTVTGTPTVPPTEKPPVTPTTPQTASSTAANTPPVPAAPPPAAPATTPAPVAPNAAAPVSTTPPGWDAQSYANFKAANPTLEPTSIDTENYLKAGYQSQIEQANADFQAKADAVSKTLLDIQHGVIPLNSGEQAQVDALHQQYQNLISTQQTQNTAAANGAYIRGYQTGSAEYDPTFAVKTIGGIVTAGSQKIADLNTQMAGAVAKLTQDFHTADMQAVKDSFSVYEDAYTKRQDTLQKMVDDANSTIKAQQDQLQKIQDNIDAISKEAAQNGAPPDVLSKLNSATSQAEAIGIASDYLVDPTSTAGQYAAYKRDAQSKGLTPMTPADFLSQQKAKDAYASAYASAQAQAAVAASPAGQNKLFQQGVSTLKSELSNRSGGLGLQDAKVNQAIHLKNLFDQYKTTTTVPNTGSAGQALPGTHEETVYNIPKVQYAELAMGLANLVSGNNQVSDSARNEIMQKTAAGDLNGAISYITGTPANGTTQDVLKNLKDSIDRQATTAEAERQTYVNDLLLRLPPGLSQENVDRLTKSAGLNSYYTPKEQVDQYVQTNPNEAQTVSQLYQLPGWTDQDVLDYLNSSQAQ